MTRTLRLIFVGILAAGSLFLDLEVAKANFPDITERKVGSLHIEDFGAYNVLRDIAQKANVPIGLSAIQPTHEKTITFDFNGGTITQLLDAFVAVSPDYRWEQSDGGTLHVFSKDSGSSLADTVISYPGATLKTRQEIWESIAKVPEVSGWMSINHCSRDDLFNGREFTSHNAPITISSGTLTLSHLLDEVASKSGVNYWAILQSRRDGSCRINILLW